MSWLTPCVACAILLYAALRRVPAYTVFAEGAKNGLNTAWGLLPNLAAMLLALGLFRAGGCLDALLGILSPVFGLLGIPAGAAPLVLLRPFSGSGSLAMLQSIYDAFGVDSREALAASAMMGSSETIFYTYAVYLAAAPGVRPRYAIAVSLASYLWGCWVAGLFFR